MTRPLLNPETPELLDDGGMDELRKQAEQKKKALEMPTRTDVTNQACVMLGVAGVYEGSWLSGGKDNVNKPGGGKGFFLSNDGTKVEGEWDGTGLFKEGKVTKNGKTYDISEVVVENGKIKTLKGKSSVNNFNYDFEMGSDFKLDKIKYSGVTLKLIHEGSVGYLVNSQGKRLKLGNVSEDLAAIRIAKCISIVKNNDENKTLDCFEADGGTLQADYEYRYADVDLLLNCYSKTGITSTNLADWLNKSRTDFGI